LASIHVLERSDHNVSRRQFSQQSLKVLNRLRSRNYDALLVGGALRDILRNRAPRDFDIVTNASIDEIRHLFRNSRVVGKRFPIVHTYFDSDVIEISSFKTEDESLDKQGRIALDASRRDYTVNAIYYDIENYQLIDPLGGIEDLEKGLIVPIGDPAERIVEDPIRILRAIKLKAIHGLVYAPGLEQAIRNNRGCIRDLGAGRKYEELTRVFLDDDVEKLLREFQEFGLTGFFWPAGSMLVNEKEPKFFTHLQENLPITSSRGSFSRESHITLWFRLFIESGVFDPVHNPATKSKEQFAQFIDPLGMPFRQPIMDTLHGITALHMANRGQIVKFEAQPEVMKLLEYYVQFIESQLRKHMRDVIKPSQRARRSKREPSKRVPNPKHAPAAVTEGESPKKTRRRRRRGKRSPSSD